MSITAARPCLRRSSRNSQILNGVVCTSIVMNFTQIRQEGNSLTPRSRLSLSVCQFSRNSEALDKFCGHVPNCPHGTNNVTSTAKFNLLHRVQFGLHYTECHQTCSYVQTCVELQPARELPTARETIKFLMCIL